MSRPVHIVGVPGLDEARVWYLVGQTRHLARLATAPGAPWALVTDERHVVPVVAPGAARAA